MSDSLKHHEPAPEQRVRLGASNNAVWCDTVCRAHGITGEFTPHAWLSPRRTPALYPDAVTLRPGVSPDDVLAGIDGSRGCSVKDSFADVDFAAAGFTVLFDARWIYRPAALASPARSEGWSVVRSPRELREWRRGWAATNGVNDPFAEIMLDDPRVVFLGRLKRTEYLAGAVANRSDGAVGISNVFAPDGSAGETWAAAVAMIATTWPNLPIVGYEHADDALTAAVDCGFDLCGPLRIWLR